MNLKRVSNIYADKRGREHYVSYDEARQCHWHTRMDWNTGELKLSGRRETDNQAIADLYRMVDRYGWTRRAEAVQS